MPFELAHEESLAENAVRLARTRLDRILGALAAIDDAPPSPEAVHESRRDLKKLRAMLRLARHTLGREVYRRENAAYRDAGRSLSGSRDAHVLLHTFDKLRPELVGSVPDEHLEAMHRSLFKDVRTAEKALGAAGFLAGLTTALAAARTRVEHWPQPTRQDGDSWHVPGRALAAAYRRGRRAMRRAEDHPAEADFHEWRKRVKHLAYHFRLLRPLSGGLFKAAGKNLDDLGDLLGNEHDLSVLAITLAREHPGLAESLATVTGHIDVRRRELQDAALNLGHHLYREKPRKFEQRLKRCWKQWRRGEG